MPCPSNREYERLKQLPNAKEEITRAYESWGWSPSISFQWVTWNPAIQMPIVTEYKVEAKDIPCSCPAKAEGVMLQLTSTGVVITCMQCRRTSGMLDSSLFRIVSEKIISLAEAERVCRETGQKLPFVIKDLLEKKEGVFQIW